MDSEFVKKRLEKDLQELKKMIEKHFEQRKADEADISELETRIEKRKEARAKQIAERAQAEQERQAREKEEKEKREKIAEEKRLAEEEKKKAALAALNATTGSRPERKKGRGTERDRKKKILAERRKPLNIDHLDTDKLKAKAKALWDHLKSLEDKRYDMDLINNDDKYGIALLRARINVATDKIGKQKRVGRLRR